MDRCEEGGDAVGGGGGGGAVPFSADGLDQAAGNGGNDWRGVCKRGPHPMKEAVRSILLMLALIWGWLKSLCFIGMDRREP